MSDRTAEISRVTGETDINVRLDIDGQGRAEIDTPIGFMNHMLHALAKHSMIDLTVKATGDIETGSHHTVEDTAIVIGRCLAQALGDGAGIVRMSSKHVPLDEALSHAVLDLSGRGYPVIDMASTSNAGDFSPDMARHFFESMAAEGRFNLHLTVLRGTNEHHMIESAFKAFARALREAATVDPRAGGAVPSTKGTLSD
ncbi:MAG: imidazoleglycerol-phosphate dehydratase HisB [Chloroflexi bacterium]|nr:imidazoleglycerol-phosphate dehydratase HisB [Chloroflexota bacterium]